MSVGQEHAIVIPESKAYVTFHEDNFVEDTLPNNEARTVRLNRKHSHNIT